MSNRTPDAGRREFLQQVTRLATLAACFPAATLAQRRAGGKSTIAADWVHQEPWKTLAAVQEHLFPPGDETPGASDIQAVVYLRNAIDNPAADAADREFVVNGVGWLNDLTRESLALPFTMLSEQEQETMLRRIEQSRAGRNWLSLLLTYLLEALLADPVYGGNPEGIGWHWLQHQPGYPAPPADKTWYKLAAPVYFKRKG